MTIRDTIRELLTDEWQSFLTLYDAACKEQARCNTHFRNSLRAMFDEGSIERKRMPNGKGWYYAYRLKPGDVKKPPKTGDIAQEAAEAPLRTPKPKGCDALSNNGRDWYRASSVPTEARYAKLADGSYLRRIRQEDIKMQTQKHWAPVTAAHVRTVANERWYK
jgi:hypothetical protein